MNDLPALSNREADVLRAIRILNIRRPHYKEIARIVWGENAPLAKQKVQQTLEGLERKGYIKTVNHEITREIIII